MDKYLPPRLETDLGVLPLPKWNEDQESYIQFMDSWCISPVVIPISASSPERSAFLLRRSPRRPANMSGGLL